MKKQIFTIILLLMGGVSGFGQFRLDGGISSVRLQTGGIDRIYIAHPTVLAPVLPGNVGIGSSAPFAKLYVNGDFALAKKNIVSAGTYHNYNRAGASVIKVTQWATLTGIADGYDGMIIHIYVTGSANLTLLDDSASSSVGNRIATGTGTSLEIILKITI